AKPDIGIVFSRHRFCELNKLMLPSIASVRTQITRQVRSFKVRATLQTTRQPHQLQGSHALAERILTGTHNLALNEDGGRIYFEAAAVDEDAVFGLDPNVIFGIAVQCFSQVDINNFQLAALGFTKNLRIRELCISAGSACHVDGIPQADMPVCKVISREPYFAGNRYNWWVLKVITPKNPYRVERFQYQIIVLTRKRVSQIKSQHGGSVVGSLQPDDLGMRPRRFRHEIAIGVQKVRNLHAFAVRVFTRPKNVPVQEHSLIGIGQDGRNLDRIAVLHIKFRERFVDPLLIIIFWKIEAQ